MKITRSASEMLQFARRTLGYSHADEGCDIEQTEGLRVDDLLAVAIRRWYLRLLDSGDAILTAADSQCRGLYSPGIAGGARISLENGVRQVFALCLDGWECEAPVLPHDSMPQVLARQLNPFTKAGPDTPVAVLAAPRTVMCWPAAATGSLQPLVGATCAVDRGADTFTFDDCALADLAAFLHKNFDKDFLP